MAGRHHPDVGPPACDAVAELTSGAGVNWLRILLVGGVMSYRALFGWMSPWILVPSLMVTPLAHILLFVYLGRSAGVGSDQDFVVGNAVQYSAIPCLFGMTSSVVGERYQRTLGILLTSPAPRLALLLGRSLPVLANGFGVAVFGLVCGGLIVGVALPLSVLGPVLLTIVVSVFGCVGLGMVNAAIGLRIQDTAVVSSLFFGVLLVSCGAVVPLSALPGWLAALGRLLPLTHGIAAARIVAAGGGLSAALRPLVVEVGLGVVYGVVGLLLLRALEIRSRRTATLELT